MLEFELIEKFFKPLTKNNQASYQLSDDTARFFLKKNTQLVTSKDLLVEDVHFLLKDGGFKIASKLLLSNLSDIASSGATPIYYMLGFSKNEKIDKKFLTSFTKALGEIQNKFNIDLIGGDTVYSPHIFFSVTIFGYSKQKQILGRDMAKENDLIFVSGNIGDSGLYLDCCKEKFIFDKKSFDFFSNRHFFPNPQIQLGKFLLENKISKCATDVSDGLLLDLINICKSSKLGAEIYLDKIPHSLHAKKFLDKNKNKNQLDLLASGEDYELIFSINSSKEKEVYQLAKKLNIKLTCIGKFVKSNKMNVNLYENCHKNKIIKIKKFGYEH